VINRATLKLNPELQEEWNTNLYTPPNIVSAQEKSQIEEKIDTWVQDLLVNTSPWPFHPIR
jgi:tRNA A64-2'-O-ribosylphosphate transferase